MNKFWEDLIQKNLLEKKQKNLFRSCYILDKSDGKTINIEGKTLINFASNNYLGLANDIRLSEAGFEYAKIYGAGAGASRLVSGTTTPFATLEKELAKWSGKESSLLFNSGYNANVGLISTFADENTVIFCDKLNHASIYDGIFLSGGILERYTHKNLSYLKKLLEKHKGKERKIIITDTVFSMEGDIAPIKEISEIALENDCLFIVDEAHSVGIFGREGAGLVSELNLSDNVAIIMGTLGKSFGVFGAYACANELITNYLINNCRSFIFTTALPPFVIGALSAALDIIKKENRGEKVLALSHKLRELLKNEGIDTGESETQIIPVIVKENHLALSLAKFLRENGFFAPAIRPPTVPPNTARVRISVCFNHTEEDVINLFEVIKKWFCENRG
ncbi:MAG: hypothetical protein A2086_14715 [Spirochaetes bacterium GWD1_27_9]|nr:MAG: hypothetical protein A2Z98_02000 [Spirochaetes bacterium GWB1_27_13]OHD22685.1 MAG: hypothetical protein A2Y34_04085 [Spirochaetes bacterium GWC1_27_15]OHD38560.1 MAG: hypothetical protein A2086_14715 [Spirochaetes bacterium GWD1_27_9]